MPSVEHGLQTLFYLVVACGLAAALAVVAIRAWLATRRQRILPDELAGGFELLVGDRKYQEAYELVRSDQRVLGRVLAAGLGALSDGHAEATKAMQRAGDAEALRCSWGLAWLIVLGVAGLAIGVLAALDAAVLAGNVDVTLAAARVSVLVSSATMILRVLLHAKLAGLMLAVELESEKLMRPFGSVDPRPAGENRPPTLNGDARRRAAPILGSPAAGVR